jgi:hypothetical protein
MRYFFVITKLDQLQPAFDVLLKAGIDVRRAYWDPPERTTNPPQRAGVTVQVGQEQESERLLTGAGITFVHQGNVTD